MESSGNLMDTISTSYRGKIAAEQLVGNHMEILRESFGSPMGVIWTYYGTLAEDIVQSSIF